MGFFLAHQCSQENTQQVNEVSIDLVSTCLMTKYSEASVGKLIFIFYVEYLLRIQYNFLNKSKLFLRNLFSKGHLS